MVIKPVTHSPPTKARFHQKRTGNARTETGYRTGPTV